MSFRWPLAALLAVSITAPAGAAVTLYGLTRGDSGRNLVSFNSETPGTFTSNVAITGAVDRSVDLFSLDLNTSNGKLYALGQSGRGQYALYSIATNGVATKIGTGLGMNIASENVGFDYDSSLDKFRVVTNDDTSFWIDPVTGLGSNGGTFAYAAGDPLGSARPNVIAAAYEGRLHVLDKNGPGNSFLLSRLSGNTLNSVAKVNMLLDTNASFDIASNGEAYFDTGVVADRLYRIDLATGAVIDKGRLALQLTGLTAAPSAAVPEPGTWATLLTGFAGLGIASRRRRRTAFSAA